jgi:hypothetical protein
MPVAEVQNKIYSVSASEILAGTFSVPFFAIGVPLVVFKDSVGPITCPLRDFFDTPCPFCGLTRDGVSLLNFRLGESVASKIGQVVILIMVAMSVLFIATALFRRRLPRSYSIAYLFTIGVLLLGHWWAKLSETS